MTVSRVHDTCVKGVLVTEIELRLLQMQFLSVGLNCSVYSREVQFSRLQAQHLLSPGSIYRARIVSADEIKFASILPRYFKSTLGQQRMICMTIG